MAVTKRSGSRRATQHPAEAPASEISQPPSRHVRVFEALADLNRGFDHVIADVERLKDLGFFRDKFSNRFAKTCPLTIEDLRAWGNFEVTEHLSNRGEAEMARSARRLHDFEKRFEDPNDILLKAERLKKKLAEKAAKKTTGKKNLKEGAE
jgi:hypothetical protein